MVLKAVAPGVLHKSDVGGVRLHLRGAAAVRRAAEKMTDSVQRAAGVEPTGFVVQRMALPGSRNADWRGQRSSVRSRPLRAAPAARSWSC